VSTYSLTWLHSGANEADIVEVELLGQMYRNGEADLRSRLDELYAVEIEVNRK
jgi:hypothetical protein